MQQPHIFVYGTLRHEYVRLPKSQRRLTPPNALHSTGTFVAKAKLFNYRLLDLGEYPAILPSDGSFVIGDVFSVPDENILEVLDEYEGIGGLYDRPYEYRRQLVRVQLGDASMSVWTYVYNWQPARFEWIDGGDYVAHYMAKLATSND
ncbi:putative gamma-glutamylcyclotransferase [Gracilariopsis chorda]|uniref:Putative gamma-glutamylcyclotransferase n=1 Tax=Gracilariopsis chorda TaxID=448386 RepID=A0A2V3IP10_9FLOR|nr:putative gamma-glutamylcyclotransferase [Gracilariopsis chorda]|eukprot:PXF43818.1 putative gamma-glutamylcyclotransferase [Gracilariopsis chorda]